MSRSARPTFLVLYTELAPYVLACFNALVEAADADLHLVRWPVNKEAPFELHFHERITVHERRELSDDALLALVRSIRPALCLTSGWVDKGYLSAAAEVKRLGGTSILGLDTAWRGDARQWANALLSRFKLRRSFTWAWVPGASQARYARRLGFADARIRTGVYSADADRFTAMGKRLLSDRNAAWPHRMLCVARYIPTKGHQLLCDAFAELCDAREAGDWELWIAGTGELLEQVSDSASGRHARIRHLGFKQVDEMNGIVEQCGAFVLPSLFEPWGVVVHEHASTGLPLVLSSAVGAAERFLIDGENGFSFAAGDRESLKAALRKLMHRSDNDLRAMGQRSLELGRSWSPDSWAGTAIGIMMVDKPSTLFNQQPATTR